MEPIEENDEQDLAILQIKPALPGWGAVWDNIEEPAQGEPGYFTEPVCWALVKARDGHRFVTAMAPDLETSELRLMLDMDNFLGYATPTYTLDWMQRAFTKRNEQQAPNLKRTESVDGGYIHETPTVCALWQGGRSRETNISKPI